MRSARRRALIPVLALALGCMFGLVTPAHADCVGFGFRLDPDEAAPGDAIEARGTRFTTCEDVGIGCAPPPEPQPLDAIEIWFRQGERATLLATVDADANGAFRVDVTVPADAEPGRAHIDADGTREAIRIAPPSPPADRGPRD